MSLTGMAHYLLNFFPIITILDYCVENHTMVKNFIDSERNPTDSKLIHDAIQSNGPNFVKGLCEFDFTDTYHRV